MNKIHILDDHIEARHLIQDKLSSILSSPRIATKSYDHFDQFLKAIPSFGSDDLFIIDLSIGTDNSSTFDVYQHLHKRIKYPHIVLFSSYHNSDFKHFLKNPEYDKISFISKANGLEGLVQVIQSWEEQATQAEIKNNALVISHDFQSINQNLLESLLRNPKTVYELNPRKFEELVADLFSFEGYEVQLTPSSNDGGKDIYAYKKDFFNEYLFAIECKKYSPANKVGRPIIQKLNGVVEHEKLTGGILVTSSFFTQPAKDFTEDLKNRIFLNDYFDLFEVIKKHGLRA